MNNNDYNSQYLISIDLDGTLLQTLSRGIHSFNKIVVEKLLALGHIIILATGRPVSGCRNIYRWMNMDHPIICNSGATIYENKKNKLVPLKIFSFRESAIKQLLELREIAEGSVSIMLQNKSGFFLTRINEDIIEYTLVEKFHFFTECSIDLLPLADTFSIAILFQRNVDMGACITKIHQIENNYFHAFEVLVGKIFDTTNRQLNAFRLLDVIAAKTSKAEAISYLQNKFEIPIDKVMVFGDSDNDISALQKFHHGSVAMKNALPATILAARYITRLDNNSGGVGEYLNEIFKLRLKYPE